MRAALPLLLIASFTLILRASADPFDETIRPLLETHCIKCHGEKKQKGNLRLDARTSALQGGDDGPAIVPGKPDQSHLLDRITSTDPALQMPPEGERLPPSAIKTLHAWIAAGAPWPESESDREKAQKKLNHWSVQPLTTSFPQTTTIDSLIQTSLAHHHLSPSRSADRRTLIRRLTFDLLGLPPSPDQVDRFVHDPDPNAYEKLVD